MTRRIAIVIGFLSLLALIAGPVWEGRQQWHWGQGNDDGFYWVTAKSLASGEGYRVISLPGKPYSVKYPPLYPLYLSIAWRLQPSFPASLSVAAGLQALLLPIYLALLLILFRQFGFTWRRSFLLAGMTIVTLQAVLLTIMLFSELLFGCFLIATVLVTERATTLTGRASRWWALVGGLLAGLAYLTRNAALPIFAAVPVFLFLRRRLSLAPYFFAFALPIAGGWHLWTFAHANPNVDPVNTNYFQEYLRAIQLSGFWPMVFKQTAALSGAVADTFITQVNDVFSGIPLQNVFLLAAVAGAIRLGRKRSWPLFVIFTGFYLVMLVCWWFEGISRLIAPVWPVLLAGIAEEASHFASLCERSIGKSKSNGVWISAPRWAMVLLAIVILARNDRETWRRVSSMMADEHRLRVNDLPAFSWIAGHARKDAVVLAWKDPVTYLYTGVPASHSLFEAVMPPKPDAIFKGSFSSLPQGYESGLLLLSQSDVRSDSSDHALDGFRARAEALPGAILEYSSAAALIYSFPLKTAGSLKD